MKMNIEMCRVYDTHIIQLLTLYYVLK